MVNERKRASSRSRRAGSLKMKTASVAVFVWLVSAGLLWWSLSPKPRATLLPADWRPGSYGLSDENYRLVGFSGDGKILATLDEGSRSGRGPIRLWDVATATQQATFLPNGYYIEFAEFSPNGGSLLCWCRAGDKVTKWVLIDP